MNKSILLRLRILVRKIWGKVLGTELRLHKIPFGPIRGQSIYMSPQMSPRMWIGIDEPWVVRASRQWLKPDDIVYDLGAHVGYTTILYARSLKGTGHVHAFEILPSTAEMLRKTIDANHFENVSIHIVGAGVEELELELPVGHTAMTSLRSKTSEGQAVELCRVVRLDTYRKEQNLPLPNLIKMDIEGAEIDCLEGSRDLINECRPIMIIAFHSRDLLVQGYDLLTELEYTLHNETTSMTRDAALTVQEPYNNSVLCVPKERTE